MKNPYRVAYRDNVTHSPNKMRISASDTYKLYYLNESGGELCFFIDGTHTELKPGEAILIPERTFNGLVKKSKARYARLVSLFPAALLDFLKTADSEVAELLSSASVFKVGEEEMLEFSDIIASLDDTQTGVAAIELILRQLKLLSRCERRMIKSPVRDGLVDKILERLDEECLMLGSAEEVADRLGYSKNYLSKFFKQKMSIGLHDFLIAKKLFVALKMLTEGASVTDVSYACGFSGASHFISVFRAHYGMTPKQYVRQMIEN